MSEIDVKSDLTSNEEILNIKEIKKEKKKFSILAISSNNEEKFNIPGRSNTIMNNNDNLITFNNSKNKMNLTVVLKNVNNDLEALQNDLSKSLKIFKTTKQFEQSTNARYKSSSDEFNKKYNIIQSKETQNYPNFYKEFNNLKKDQQTQLESENRRLKQRNKKLEQELLDYKKYLDNMTKEKK